MSKNIYDIVAFNSDGVIVYSERCTLKTKANKLAKEFLPYVNVFTCDILQNNKSIARYVKLAPNSGIVIVNGVPKNIRF